MESLAADLQSMQRTPLQQAHVDAIRATGTERTYDAGQSVAEIGDPMDEFIYLLEGEIELVNPLTHERHLPHTLGPTQFVGEIAFLNSGAYTMPMRACKATKTIVVPREKMLALMSQIPEMSDIIITVFAARRRRQIEASDSGLTLIGIDNGKDIQRIAAFANRNRIAFRALDLHSEEAIKTAQKYEVHIDTPAVIFGKNAVIEDPTPRSVARALGLDLSLDKSTQVDLLIVGGGPSGVAAGVYAGAEGIDALVVDEIAIGGQAGTSSRIENYMGFPTGISGADLLWRGEVQALKFGTRFAVPRKIISMTRQPDGQFCAGLDDDISILAKSVLIATGVQYRRLPLENLAKYEGAGIYYAATESETRFCKNTDAIVIGGGNSAGQAAMYLSRTANHVHVLIRGKSLALSMSNYLSSRLEADPKITLHFESEVSALHGENHLEQVSVLDKAAQKTETFNCRALFIMVGAAPNTDWLSGLAELDNKGFVLTGEAVGQTSPYATSQEGLFAVGDVRAGSVKRVASSVGEGSVVISHIWQYLN